MGWGKKRLETCEAYGAREKAAAVKDKWLIMVLAAVRLLRLRVR